MGCGESSSSASPAPKAGNTQHDKKTSEGMPEKKIQDGGFGKSMFILENKDKIVDLYDLEKKKLGEGSYGSVCKGKNKSTQQVRAIKTIPKAQMTNIDRFKQEIAIMKMMDHPNIIRLFETFQDTRNIYLVMELCAGGELFDKIIESGHFTEAQAAILMQHIFKAMYYMHSNHVCHRDLKPENFLFLTKEAIEKNTLKIIDFGLSCTFEANVVLTTKAGTPYYVAPQVLAGKYDQLSDLWSCGVIMYVMLCGYPPFFGETDAEVLSKVRLGNFSFNQADWKNVSEDAKNLIRNLLKMNPKDRYTAEQTLNHDWIKNKAPQATNACLQQNQLDNLRSFRSQNKLKKVALQVIANQLNEKEIKALRDIFTALDDNSDGLLTPQEMKEGLAKANLKDIPADLQQLLQDVDSDGSGAIDYTEFLAATLDKRVYAEEGACWAAFRVFDIDGDGVITKEELKQVLEGDANMAELLGGKGLEEVIQSIDVNGDGNIDFDEFFTMMKADTPCKSH